ncbi:hypothetical protein [Pelagicoccus albus]|uniref:Uncharacterized protein n=1 Tax=Pelagicoccus albus TaxID=415222 RepID=A0A7X1B7D2_9BACT|nr:hypothetical protein [Pelagicoccus albus]MBC2606887.1 hypothetical protein [Pelagicoccus albus]
MNRLLLMAALAIACVCTARDFEPDEEEISNHRRELFALARDYIVETFNLDLTDECHFNPVRFNSNGVWGNFDARIKELGADRFEVEGWVSAKGHDRNRLRWKVHIRYGMSDPEAWRYHKIGEDLTVKPTILGWKLGDYNSVSYKAEYDPQFSIKTFR